MAITLLAAPANAVEVSSPTTKAAVEKATAPYRIKPFKPRRSDNARLVKNWKKWKRHGYAGYTTVVDQSCFCVRRPPVVTTVSGKRVVSVRYRGKKRELARKGYEVDRLYRLLRRAYKQADDVEVKYRAGVPVRIGIDWEELMADEETYLTVRVRNLAVPAPTAR